mmetsp:Transcript_12650/g.38119  ORF Transcript_12650/g.38119 Transcript_12650/m.38119 type:complete len:205 (+) Transcript_12650:570-1184(+)
MRRLGRLRQARRRPLLESLRFFCCHLRGNAPGPGTLPPEHVFRIQHIRHLGGAAVELALQPVDKLGVIEGRRHTGGVRTHWRREVAQQEYLLDAVRRLGAALHKALQILRKLRVHQRCRNLCLVGVHHLQRDLAVGQSSKSEAGVVVQQHMCIGEVRRITGRTAAAGMLIPVQLVQGLGEVILHDQLHLLDPLEYQLLQREQHV